MSHIKLKVLLLLSILSLPATANSYEINPTVCDKKLLEKNKLAIDSYNGDKTILKAAYEELTISLQQNPDCAPVYRELARIMMKAGHLNNHSFYAGSLDTAKNLLKESIKIAPDYSDAYVLLASVYIHQDNYPEAKNAVLQAVSLNSKSPWLIIRKAEIAFHEKDYDAAKSLYSSLLDPKHSANYEFQRTLSTAKAGILNIYYEKEDWQKVDEIYRDKIKDGDALKNGALGDKAWPHGNYASFLLYTMGNYEKAILEAKKALDIMNYGMARSVLSMAFYLKWAVNINQGFSSSQGKKTREEVEAELQALSKSQKLAQVYFNQAHTLNPDIQQVKNQAIKHRATLPVFNSLNNPLIIKYATDNFEPDTY